MRAPLPPVPTLEAGPLVLRPWGYDDVGVVMEAGTDPFIPLISTVPARGDAADARAFVERQGNRPEEGMGHAFAIADAASGRAMGHIGLWVHTVGPGRATVGYWVAPSFRRRGVVTAALRRLATWGFAERRLDRIELSIEPWNAGSRRAAERTGFRCEGLLRAYEHVGGERRDMLLYARLAGDPDLGVTTA